ncbi:MAG: CNNM domain-containing protein [Bacteroidota bacterium]
MALLLFYLFLALFVSFLCSIMESVLLSTSDSFLKVKEEEGSKPATTFLKLKENIERPLSAILSLNTIAHTIGAAGVGAQATKIFGEVYFGVISAVLTFAILIFSEIIPKTIGARYWRRLALVSGTIMNGMVVITYPLVIMTKYITKIFAGGSHAQSMSREEISAMASIGEEEGVLEEKENKIIQNLVKLSTLKISEIMTPRVVVTIADEDTTIDDFLENKEVMRYSRIPVFTEDNENISGYVFRPEVFEKHGNSSISVKLQEIKREIIVVPEFTSVMSLWEMFLDKKEHIALIVDEYGGMAGIATMEDVIETLLGLEIVDESDQVVDMQQYARDRWTQRKSKYNILSKPPDD